MVAVNSKRIAKNALFLYCRMLLTMIVSLYTSRVVLDALGVEDYGIYNVVGGVVTIFGFLNSSMISTTQRYITFELGRGNLAQLQRTFNTSQLIHGLISLLVVILAETVGLWFLVNKMQIPLERTNAMFWVYQCSVISAVVIIMSVPYNAAIVAYEKMNAFAFISILEVSLKLIIVYLLVLSPFDKLIFYAILMVVVQILIRIYYSWYCNRYFSEMRFRLYYNKGLFKEMISFAGWNLFGNIAAIAFTQGLNVLLNIFFGPTVNAARGIAVQVQGAISKFSASFQMALNPQITKSYAKNELQYMHGLIYRSGKFSFLLLLLLSLPIFMRTDLILSFWLKNVPEYTANFVRLMIFSTIIDAMANPLMLAAAATGRVKHYQSIIGGLMLIILPISYFVLKLGCSPESVFFVHLCICGIAFIVRLFIIRPMIRLSLREYFQNVIFKCFVVLVLAIPFPLIFSFFLDSSFFSFIVICFTCALSVIGSSYFMGLNRAERAFVNERFSIVIKRLIN